MARGKSHWRMFAVGCADCHTGVNLTRHHLKDQYGKKTGEIQILCRACHNLAEERYNQQFFIELTPNEQLQLDYMNGLLPFYSLYGNHKTEPIKK